MLKIRKGLTPTIYSGDTLRYKQDGFSMFVLV